MSEKIHYVINSDLKNDYENFIINEYGSKRGNCGKTTGNLMKLQLAMNGNEKYMNDPNVIEMLDTISEKYMATHTQKENKVGTQNENHENNLENKVDNLEKEIKELKALLKENIKRDNLEKENQRYTDNLPNTLVNESLNKDEMILNDFINTYGNQNQVSKNDLTKLIMNKGLTNKQTINNKIQFLESKGVINPINPMVFNVTGINGK